MDVASERASPPARFKSDILERSFGISIADEPHLRKEKGHSRFGDRSLRNSLV